ncbi:MAG: pilus assembly protein [Actinomycetia bacterium]|nr:pilus assembly protein [Actinomycetes bacterium]
MAIILPLLVMLVFGIVEFGRAYNANISVTHAAREGVREYSISRDAGEGRTAALNAATSISLSPGDVVLTNCDSSADGGNQARVQVDYDLDFIVGIPFVSFDGVTLSAEGVMRCGG